MVDAFSATHKIVREIEADGIHELVKLVVAPMPEMLPVVVGEIAFHLRSTLDNVLYPLARGKRVSFPFAGDRSQFLARDNQDKISGLPVAA